ncbi:MAG: dynamin family protein [Neisseriaceae bacterium]|nr:dynamin family protein [Neisseriaceae bacterium]
MATSNDKIEITAEEMLAYRDELVKALNHSSDLLDQAQDAGIIEAKKGENNRIMTTEQLPELKKIIQNEIEKLQHFNVVLAVVGTMKAGKSTTINAIVGREIMPNRNQPMTTLPTLIYHTPEQTTPKLFFVAKPANDFVKEIKTILSQNPFWLKESKLQAKEMQAIIAKIQQNQCNFKSEYLGSDEIFAFLEQLNDLVRLSGHLSKITSDSAVEFPFDHYKEIEQLPKIEVAFTHLANADSTNGRLVLLDTPGPNEAGQTHLRDMLQEQLKRSSAVLLIVDYQQMGSEASDDVKKQIQDLPALDAERLFVLVNKFDQKNANSLTEEETKKYVQNVLLPKIEDKEQVKAENIFPISAYNAFIANRMLIELKNNGKPEYQNEWVKDFAKQAFGETDADEWADYTQGQIQKKIDKLLENSLIQEPIKKAIQNTQKNAPQIAIKSALSKCQSVLEKLHNACNVWTTTLGKTEEEIQQLEQTIAECQNDINQLNDLEQRIQKEVQDIQQSVQEDTKTEQEKAQKEVQDWIDKFVKGQIGTWKQKESKLLDETSLRAWLFTYDENFHKKKDELQLMLDKLQKSKKTISFDDEDAARQFCKSVVEQYNTTVQAAYNKLQETIDNQSKQIEEKLKNTENETQQVFNRASDHLGKAGFDLQLSIPQIGDFSPLPQNNLDSSIDIEEKTHRYRVESGGLGIVKRGAGWLAKKLGYDNDWGYEERTRESFDISKEKLRNTLNQAFEKQSQSISEEIKRVLDAFNDDWVKNYIGTVQNKVNEVLGEINTAIAQHNKSKEEKEKIQTAVQKINERYLEMNSTLKMVRDNVCPELK